MTTTATNLNVPSSTGGGSGSEKRDPLQSPVFKLRGLEMTVYGLEKENLELRQTIEVHEKEINQLKNTVREYEMENERHERRHAQLEEEIIELRQQLKHMGGHNNANNIGASSSNNNQTMTPNSLNGVDMSSLRLNNSSSGMPESNKFYDDSSLYLYTGRNSPGLSHASSFNSTTTSTNNHHNSSSNNHATTANINISGSSNSIATSSMIMSSSNNNSSVNCNINNSSDSNNNNSNNHNNNSDAQTSSTPAITTSLPPISNQSRSPFQKGKPPSSPTIVSCVTDGVNTGVNISMTPSPVIPQPRKKSIISLFSL